MSDLLKLEIAAVLWIVLAILLIRSCV